MNKHLFLILTGMILFAGCHRNEDTRTEEQKAMSYINKAIFEATYAYYLWYKEIPGIRNYSQQPETFFDGLLYKVKDRWSFIIDKGTFYMSFLQGNVYGAHGFDVINDASNNLRVAYVFPGTIAADSGIHRSWQVLKVNGQIATYQNYQDLLGEPVPGDVDTFLFQNGTGQVTMMLAKESFVSKTVLRKDTLHVGATVVGYIMFNEFRGTDSEAELDSAFAYLNDMGATELILDMRYNPGGMNETAHYLANLIAGKFAAGETFVKYVYSDKLTANNESVAIAANGNAINLPNKRIYILATANSASCSEIMINCLKPLMTVYTIGSTTHGKPVGMNVLELRYYDYMVAPISFSSYNKSNQGDYYSGIAPDCQVTDDVSHELGDRNEWMLAQALAHIQTGSFSAVLKSAPDQQFIPQLKRSKPTWNLSINKIITIE